MCKKSLGVAVCGALVALTATRAHAGAITSSVNYRSDADTPLSNPSIEHFYTEPSDWGYEFTSGGMIVGGRHWDTISFDFGPVDNWDQTGEEYISATLQLTGSADPGGYPPDCSPSDMDCFYEQPCSGGGAAPLLFTRTMYTAEDSADVEFGPWVLSEGSLAAIRGMIVDLCGESHSRADYLTSLISTDNADFMDQIMEGPSTAPGFVGRVWPRLEEVIGPSAIDRMGEILDGVALDGVGELEAEEAADEALADECDQTAQSCEEMLQMSGCSLEDPADGEEDEGCALQPDEAAALREEIRQARAEAAAARALAEQARQEIQAVRDEQNAARELLSKQTSAQQAVNVVCGSLSRIGAAVIIGVATNGPNMMRVDAMVNAACIMANGILMTVYPGRNPIVGFWSSVFLTFCQAVADYIASTLWVEAQCARPDAEVACPAAHAHFAACFFQARIAWGAAIGMAGIAGIAHIAGWI